VSREASNIGDMLRGAGLRRTPVRLAVLGAVTSTRSSMAAPDIIGRLSADTDAVTVYRTLNTLVEHKLLHRVRGEDGAWRYAATREGRQSHDDHPHAHFVCDTCGGVECLDRVPVPAELAKPKSLGRRYDVTYAELLVHGVCPNCQD
jgi:Fur family ferric uptake transcriptional regulator